MINTYVYELTYCSFMLESYFEVQARFIIIILVVGSIQGDFANNAVIC